VQPSDAPRIPEDARHERRFLDQLPARELVHHAIQRGADLVRARLEVLQLDQRLINRCAELLKVGLKNR
jgi:hypothetical protein